MRHRVGAGVGVVATVALLMGVTAAPAGAAVSGPETFTGFLMASTSNGQRRVLATGLQASGVFNGHGRIVELDSLPGDPGNVLRDDLVFRDGAMHLVSTDVGFSFDLDPLTCLATFHADQIGVISGGTGRFADAHGDFTGSVDGSGVVRRLANGACDENGFPSLERDQVAATGTLQF